MREHTFVAERAGWPAFFVLSIAVAVPAILLIPRVPIDDDEDEGDESAGGDVTPAAA